MNTYLTAGYEHIPHDPAQVGAAGRKGKRCMGDGQATRVFSFSLFPKSLTGNKSGSEILLL